MGEYHIQQLYYLTVLSVAIITVPGIAAAFSWWMQDRRRIHLSRDLTGAVPLQDGQEEHRAAA